MSLALVVVVFHVVKTRECRLCQDTVALAARITDGLASNTTQNVCFSILKYHEYLQER